MSRDESSLLSGIPRNRRLQPAKAARGELPLAPMKDAGSLDTQDENKKKLSPADIERLIVHQYGGLCRLVTQRTGDRDLANDVLQEAIATAWEHLQAGRISRPDQIVGYVFQVAMNQLRNRRRKFADRPDRRAEGEALDQLTAAEAAPTLELGTNIVAQVRALIAELPTERDRQIVKRFYLDEEDKEVICKELSLSSLHFDKVIFRARQRMRDKLEVRGFKKSDFFSILLVFLR
jgi:RNA polymerase sigma-70 factor, ECF subfamily